MNVLDLLLALGPGVGDLVSSLLGGLLEQRQHVARRLLQLLSQLLIKPRQVLDVDLKRILAPVEFSLQTMM